MTIPLSSAQRSAARVAAIAFPIALFAVAFANFGLRGSLIVEGDTPETVRRIAAAESVYRVSVGLDLIYSAGMVVLLTALYAVLGPINRTAALLAAGLKLIYAGTAVLIALSSLTILRLATGPAYNAGLGSDALHALVDLTARGAWDQYYVGLVFWAGSSTLFAWLWWKSRYIPAALAISGILASAWCALCAVAFLLDPAFGERVNVWLFDTPMALFYLGLSGWVLVKGLRRDPDRVGAGSSIR